MGEAVFANFRQAVTNLSLARSVVPGASVALTDRERTLYAAGIGSSDPVAGIPVDTGHLFQIGSISKSFTAIALLQQRDEAHLDLHAPVSEYLPWFEVRSRFAPITVHHLLTHTAGIVTGMDFTQEGLHEVWALRETEAAWPPGERYLYSNAGYKALGLVLEAVAGQPWWEIVRSRVIEPLGMRETVPIITHDVRRRLAGGWEPFYDDRPWQPQHGVVPAPWLESATADGTICSTASDMAIYVRMLLNRGVGDSGRLLSEENFELLTQRAIAADDEGSAAWYGYGIVTRERHGHTLIGHSGGMVGYAALIVADIDSGFGSVILLNGRGERLDAGLSAIEALEAEANGNPLPPVPETPDPARIEDASDYAGTYRSGDRSLSFTAEGDRLFLERGRERIRLERAQGDSFLVPHPEFERFALRFERGGNEVVGVTHGPDWFTNERYTGPAASEHEAEWERYVGHYRSYNPWASNFRVVIRKGALWLIATFSEDHADGELIPLGEGSFRLKSEDGSPSGVRFHHVIDGMATRAVLDCAPFYRTFTP
jgi:CubicO group peptidase (beta-lactamase class C family)